MYDAAYDLTDDGENAYLYDAEGRICAANTMTGMVGYLYDADGHRVAEGNITHWGSCDSTQNGFTQVKGFVVDGGGQQLTEVDSANNWLHTDVWAAGRQIGTFDGALSNPALHLYLDDPLGTRRVQANASGVLEAVYQSLPFGDGLTPTCAAGYNGQDPTENHFTGKERDTESGNDYMFARYYNSATGRFLSPDWSAKAEPVPYAKLGNPQSLNLYSYVYNNPINGIDPDGHFASPWHFLLSFAAALSVGDNPFTAAKLGFQTAWADVGTQGRDGPSANIHAMRGIGQSVDDAVMGTAESVREDEESGNVGRELHTVQDPFSKAHQGYADWSKGYGSVGDMLHINLQIGYRRPAAFWVPSKRRERHSSIPKPPPILWYRAIPIHPPTRPMELILLEGQTEGFMTRAGKEPSSAGKEVKRHAIQNEIQCDASLLLGNSSTKCRLWHSISTWTVAMRERC